MPKARIQINKKSRYTTRSPRRRRPSGLPSALRLRLEESLRLEDSPGKLAEQEMAPHTGLDTAASDHRIPDMNNAILLVGPTGAGKTPLGEILEERGLGHRKCLHFDFGEQLRRAAAGHCRIEQLVPHDIDFIRLVLQTGAVLEDQHFHIAEAILRAFIAGRSMGGDDLIVLNGLPRQVGQAHDIARLADVRLVAHLSCPAEVAFERIRTNAGGDRANRLDDSLESVKNRMLIFAARTAPLLDHYRSLHDSQGELNGVPVVTLEVTATATAESLWKKLSRKSLHDPRGGI